MEGSPKTSNRPDHRPVYQVSDTSTIQRQVSNAEGPACTRPHSSLQAAFQRASLLTKEHQLSGAPEVAHIVMSHNKLQCPQQALKVCSQMKNCNEIASGDSIVWLVT